MFEIISFLFGILFFSVNDNLQSSINIYQESVACKCVISRTEHSITTLSQYAYQSSGNILRFDIFQQQDAKSLFVFLPNTFLT